MEFLNHFITRWNKISVGGDDYRLLCSHPVCSLSCANLKKGRILVTSVHGDERHSYEFTKSDMMFATISFLNHLSKSELDLFLKVYNTNSPSSALTLENKEDK